MVFKLLKFNLEETNYYFFLIQEIIYILIIRDKFIQNKEVECYFYKNKLYVNKTYIKL